MKKLIVILVSLLIILSGCSKESKVPLDTSKSDIQVNQQKTETAQKNSEQPDGKLKTVVAVKVGDYVEFGSYLGEKILWRVMEINEQKPILWSEYLLTMKCYDAAESGKALMSASAGGTYQGQLGSNVWSNSNIREWLNSTGTVKWSTMPPRDGAIQGQNSYNNEQGFLSDFTDAERALIFKTNRNVNDDQGNLKETTKDLVFLASYDEVKDGGRWNLNQGTRKKSITAAVANPSKTSLKVGETSWYFLETPYSKIASELITVYDDGSIDGVSACSSWGSIAPALQLSSINPVSGSGTKDKPWK